MAKSPKQETQEDFTIEQIREWQSHPMTQRIWSEFERLKELEHTNLHAELAKGNFQEAANCNAGYTMAADLINVPDNLITELKEEKDRGQAGA